MQELSEQAKYFKSLKDNGRKQTNLIILAASLTGFACLFYPYFEHVKTSNLNLEGTHVH